MDEIELKHINFDLTWLKQWNIPWHIAHKFESFDTTADRWETRAISSALE